MKTSLTYGFLMALGSAVLTLLMFFAGMHDSTERMRAATWTGFLGGLTIATVCLALAMREKRANALADVNWTYGSALGTGVLTALWGAVVGAIFAYIYFSYINPNFLDVLVQSQLTQMENSGRMSASQMANVEPMLRKFMSAPILTAWQTVVGFLIGLVLSLIVAIFFRQRPAVATEGSSPPPIG